MKAQTDMYLIMVNVFIMVIGIMVVYAAFNSIGTDTPVIGGMIAQAKTLIQYGDFFIVLIFVGVTVLSCYLSYNTATSKMYIAINIVLVILSVMLGGTLSEVFVDIIGDPDLAIVSTVFPMAYYLMLNFHFYLTCFGLLNLFALFCKPETLPDQGGYIIEG